MYGRGRRVLDDMPSFILETNLILFYYYQYVNESRIARQGIDNFVPVSFTDGAYYNFPESQKIQDGIYLVKAKGHTRVEAHLQPGRRKRERSENI